MTQDALRTALLDARVPRYTSYPPASRFSPEIGPARHRDWLVALPADKAVSLYIHIPFCRRLCWFCACRTQGTTTTAPLNRYLETLEAEIALVKGIVGRAQPLSALHLGGGTPTLLEPAQIARLGAMIREGYGQTAETELSVEIDPCELDFARVGALMAIGLTRASIGVQDFDPAVQDAIGRQQSAETTAIAVEALRARGIGSVNFDLLYGLPFQTEARLAATLAEVLRHRPDRIALYGYAHVPWMAKRQKLIPEHALPCPEARLELAALARETLIGAGYRPVGIDHYALPGDPMAVAAESGRLRRNFQGYTTDDADALIALGPSAISRFPGGYAQNAPATRDWTRAVEAGSLPTARGVALTAEDLLVARVIEGLMCRGAFDFGDLGADRSLDVAALVARAEAALVALPGIGSFENGVLAVSDMAYARILAARIDPGMARETGQFSLAS